MLSWSVFALWSLLDANIWGANAASEFEGKVISLAVIKIALNTCYVEYDEAHPGHPCTRLTDLTPKMVGLGGSVKRLKTKAMETFYIVTFLVQLLPAHLGALGPSGISILESGRCLLNFVAMLKRAPVVISYSVAGELLDVWKRYMTLVEPFDIYTPKAHLTYHMVLRSMRQGNPWGYNTFFDEGLNKLLKRTLRLCHQATFEFMAMVKFGELLMRTGRPRLS